jgi:hypothetical protein
MPLHRDARNVETILGKINELQAQAADLEHQAALDNNATAKLHAEFSDLEFHLDMARMHARNALGQQRKEEAR